jgi:hypothetical protein
MLRHSLHYRRDAFNTGLVACGFDVVEILNDPQPGDVLVVWNLYGGYYERAQMFASRGAHVIVAENGWLGKDWRDGEWFTLCLDHHIGAGRWLDGGPSRWDSWSVELAPWREPGGDVVILAQRGIGERGYASPVNWAENTRARIGCGRIRAHPGTLACSPKLPSLESDLASASDVVTWASGAALKALVMGVSVWNDMPQWIGAKACRHVSEFKAGCGLRDDEARLNMFRRMAWSMWTLDEIRSGYPFLRLMLCK